LGFSRAKSNQYSLSLLGSTYRGEKKSVHQIWVYMVICTYKCIMARMLHSVSDIKGPACL